MAVVGVRLGSEVVSRIDAVCGSGGRSEWLRNLILRELDGVGSVGVPAAVPEGRAKAVPEGRVKEAAAASGGLSDRALEVLAYVRGRAVSSRSAEVHFGWLGLTYVKAERELLKAGLVVVIDGVLHAT